MSNPDKILIEEMVSLYAMVSMTSGFVSKAGKGMLMEN